MTGYIRSVLFELDGCLSLRTHSNYNPVDLVRKWTYVWESGGDLSLRHKIFLGIHWTYVRFEILRHEDQSSLKYKPNMYVRIKPETFFDTTTTKHNNMTQKECVLTLLVSWKLVLSIMGTLFLLLKRTGSLGGLSC